jgi:hypothetical protein
MNVESESDNLLGKEITSYNNLHIYENGIIYDDDYMLWDEIENIYIGGATTLINLMPAFEDRKIILVDSTTERQIKIFVSSLFLMKKEKAQIFNDVYATIIAHVAKRQWRDFLKQINNGIEISYENFKLSNEAFYFKKHGRIVKISNVYILGYEIIQGGFYILYQEPDEKMKKQYVGSIENIPNVHILQAHIDVISKFVQGEQHA